MSTRIVVEVRSDLHRELRKLAAEYDKRLFMAVNLLLEECLSDKERVARALRKIRG